MQRARGPWWAALLLLAPSVIAACDRDDGDTADSSDDEAAEDASAGSDASDDSSEADGGDQELLTCRDLQCPVGHVCVQPRAYCDESTDPPELRRDPAYCQPLVSPPDQSRSEEELVLSSGVAMCDGPELIEGPYGQVVVQCPDEPPCG